MRDVRLARRQLLGGLVGFVGAGLLVGLVLIPQIGVWQELKAQKSGLSNKRPETLRVLPDLTALGDKRFRQESKVRLTSVCQQQGYTVERVDIGNIHVNPYSEMPSGVQEIPIAVRVKGARNDIQPLLRSLSEAHPNLQFTSIQITAPQRPIGPSASPSSALGVTLYARGILSVWKPEL